MPRRRRHPCLSLCLYLGFALAVTAFARAAPAAVAVPSIEVCFVLDTTGSMASLVAGAKQKIWAIANEIVRLEPQPAVSFCLMGFRDRGDDYVTRLTDMTVDMDAIYADLSAFEANGGGDTPEAVNQALFETLTRVAWSRDDATIRVIYLTGDAPPHTDYADEMQIPEIMALARSMGIVVNTIQCGDQRETTDFWRRIAGDGGGRFARIAQGGNVKVVSTPLDQDFVALQGKLAATVLPWGDAERRARIDDAQRTLGAAAGSVVADRLSYFSRVGKVIAGEGDLLADLASGRVDLERLGEEQLPASLRGLSPGQRRERLAELAADRAEYQRVIAELAEERRLILAVDDPAADNSFDREVIAQIKALAAERGFALD